MPCRRVTASRGRSHFYLCSTTQWGNVTYCGPSLTCSWSGSGHRGRWCRRTAASSWECPPPPSHRWRCGGSTPPLSSPPASLEVEETQYIPLSFLDPLFPVSHLLWLLNMIRRCELVANAKSWKYNPTKKSAMPNSARTTSASCVWPLHSVCRK